MEERANSDGLNVFHMEPIFEINLFTKWHIPQLNLQTIDTIRTSISVLVHARNKR